MSCLAFAPDGTALTLSGSPYLEARVRIGGTSLPLDPPAAHGSKGGAAWFPDGTVMAYSAPGGVALVDFPDLRQVGHIKLEDGVEKLAFVPDGSALLVRTERSRVLRFADPDGEALKAEHFAVAGATGLIALLAGDRLSWYPPRGALQVGEGYSRDVDVCPRGERAAVVLSRGVCVYELSTARLLQRIERDIQRACFSPDGSLLGVTYYDKVEVYRIGQRQPLSSWGGGSIAWSPQGDRLGSEGRLWTLKSDDPLRSGPLSPLPVGQSGRAWAEPFRVRQRDSFRATLAGLEQELGGDPARVLARLTDLRQEAHRLGEGCPERLEQLERAARGSIPEWAARLQALAARLDSEIQYLGRAVDIGHINARDLALPDSSWQEYHRELQDLAPSPCPEPWAQLVRLVEFQLAQFRPP